MPNLKLMQNGHITNKTGQNDMTERALNYHELKKKTGLARSTVFTLEKEGKFPKRRRFGNKAVRWIESEVV